MLLKLHHVSLASPPEELDPRLREILGSGRVERCYIRDGSLAFAISDTDPGPDRASDHSPAGPGRA